MSDSTNVSVRPAGAGQVRRRAAALKDPNKPLSTRAAGAGGSSNTMMRLYTSDDTPGLRVSRSIGCAQLGDSVHPIGGRAPPVEQSYALLHQIRATVIAPKGGKPGRRLVARRMQRHSGMAS
ncbi:hypothetical protein E5Q_04182 [Mixia osmundae IAM 14324]|uniref:Uncharacterized protein n=1 Tax=Mixia osmundae (strain CBS 9802 / IAM 14324 / JCM 22182 / KY 12970) TaxID=764103 RepID=G7E3U4_MIXOS|nr:hypothetical protein E5Q_04182 [Mixia osmundae IAM 14324]